jgi:DNA-binding transcriptional LysR family regulator
MDKFHVLLSKGGLSLERLHNFCRIAEAGSLSKAAEGDAGKLSLFSRQIRELEGFFGVELKRRQGKGIVITEAGRRLAQLTRAHLHGLEDFQREVRQIPRQLSIAAGNSILEWTLMPKLPHLRKALPGTLLQFYTERTMNTVSKLIDMTFDIGLVRENALVPPLKWKRLYMADYALFVPRSLANSITEANLRERIAEIPLAASLGGQFRETLETSAAKAKWPLNICVSTASYTQSARAVRIGACGAVLPKIAAAEFDPSKVVQLPLPFLCEKFHHICLVWNPRLTIVREIVAIAAQRIPEIVAVSRAT